MFEKLPPNRKRTNVVSLFSVSNQKEIPEIDFVSVTSRCVTLCKNASRCVTLLSNESIRFTGLCRTDVKLQSVDLFNIFNPLSYIALISVFCLSDGTARIFTMIPLFCPL